MNTRRYRSESVLYGDILPFEFLFHLPVFSWIRFCLICTVYRNRVFGFDATSRPIEVKAEFPLYWIVSLSEIFLAFFSIYELFTYILCNLTNFDQNHEVI